MKIALIGYGKMGKMIEQIPEIEIIQYKLLTEKHTNAILKSASTSGTKF